MERLATGRANANAGDRSSYVAMADTFRLDFVGTKAGIKGASVVMGYLETGMRVLDAASSLLSRLQELAVLGANDTNTSADLTAIDLEANAIADEFNRLMQNSTYKGKDVFVTTAGSEYVSLGGRDAEMTFGIGDITYTGLYNTTRTDLSGGPSTGLNNTTKLTTLPSELLIDKAGADVADPAAVTSLVSKIETVQALVNTARVQAGSQYAALESAVSFTTDLTAQYELGFNTVNDVNFSMETAHLAKNQILQQAATAMLAQANQGQQGLLQLIQA
jgi:flagellin